MRGWLVVIGLLAGLALLADRVAVGMAEGRVAEELAASSGVAGRPQVDITGFPFLTQAVSGRYEHVRVVLGPAELGQPEGTRAAVSLRGVQVPLSDALSGSVQEVPVERIDGAATLSYDLLAAELDGDATITREGEGLRLTRTVEVVGRTLPLTAAGTVTLDDGDLVVDVEQAAGAGVDLPGFLVDRVSDLLDLRYPVPELPFGLQLIGVAPAPDGVEVRVEADDALIRAE